MYAIADIKGFQYRIQEGDQLRVSNFDVETGTKLTIPEVLFISDGEKVSIGAPYVDGAKVEATVIDNGKYDKILIFKKKRRKDYSVKRGHRQDFTEIKIDKIIVG